MTHEQFCYWLQDFLELSGEGASMTPEQVKMVREHLATCFVKVTPPLQEAPPVRSGTSPADWLLRQPDVTCGVVGIAGRSFC
jgi:hypothetical protein